MLPDWKEPYFVTAVIVQIGRILRNSFRRHMLFAAAVVAGLVIIIVVVAGADSQLAALYRTECSTACTAVADVGTERSRIAFESATHGDNVQNTAHTFSIILVPGLVITSICLMLLAGILFSTSVGLLLIMLLGFPLTYTLKLLLPFT